MTNSFKLFIDKFKDRFSRKTFYRRLISAVKFISSPYYYFSFFSPRNTRPLELLIIKINSGKTNINNIIETLRKGIRNADVNNINIIYPPKKR